MHDDIQAVPIVVQLLEDPDDLLVTADVAGKRNLGFAFARQFFHPAAQLLVLVGKGEICAFALHGRGNTPGNRAVARQADDECALALQKSHDVSSSPFAVGII